MTSYLWILLSAAFVISRAQDLDLADAFDDLPTAKPGPPQTPKPPKKDGGFDLSDALGPDVPSEPKKPTLKPSKSGGDFDLPDALDGPPKRGGGGFSDSDLTDLTDDDGYKPDPNKGGRAGDNTHDSTAGDAGQTKDLNQQCRMLLKFLGDNMPEGLRAWIANSKVIISVLEKLMELLDLAEGEKLS